MTSFLPIMDTIATYTTMIYSLLVLVLYVFFAIVSSRRVIEHLKKNNTLKHHKILFYPDAPSVSIILPVYNASNQIIEKVQQLLALKYNHLEVIVVNDDSTDDTLQTIINKYKLQFVDYYIHKTIETNKIRGVYKSDNDAFSQLIVVDKYRAGETDALNVGVNVSRHRYILSINIDDYLEPDCLQKLVQPLLDSSHQRVVVSQCTIGATGLFDNTEERNVPYSFFGRAFILENIRLSLLNNRSHKASSEMVFNTNKLSLLDKEIVICSNGYASQAKNIHLNLILRMKEYMHKNNIQYQIHTLQETLCWTKAPLTLKTFIKKKISHSASFMDVKKKYCRTNSEYFRWLFFGKLKPIIEGLGLLLILFLMYTDQGNGLMYLLVFVLNYCFSIVFSVWAILIEILTYYRYQKWVDIIKLLLTSIFYPVLYYPIVFYAKIRIPFKSKTANSFQ